MPPRSGRASKACELCRKHKTRCYTSQSARGSCLRCKTLCQICSLSSDIAEPIIWEQDQPQDDESNHNANNTVSRPFRPQISVDERLDRLERIVENLVNRLDGRVTRIGDSGDNSETTAGLSIADADTNTAPVFLIRDAATDAGLHSPEMIESAHPPSRLDVISKGLVTLATAHALLEIFHVHYGRWVKFPEHISTATLLSMIRKSPLLVSSVLLIAVRHTTQDLANRLAPKLFQEARSLVTSSLLMAPQSIEFFQSALILSLWSTTIGQVPMSIDSWLLTGYALQQALASPEFVGIFRAVLELDVSMPQTDAWCLWNHLCLAHLQYCVGTRRQAVINQGHIDHCVRLIQSDNITNYESRMVAEVSLYWIIHQKCCLSDPNLPQTKLALETWRQSWSALFEQPRSQFLQMGFHFAYLLVYGQFLRSSKEFPGGPNVVETTVLEMIKRSTAIINLAIETTDERTRHLTDQIYHIITFSALTLCRLVDSYESKLRAANHNVDILDTLVMELVQWLRSVGLPCHAAHIMGNILSAQFNKIRRHIQPRVDLNSPNESIDFSVMNRQPFSGNVDLLFPDFIGSEFLNMAMETAGWPDWGEIYPESEI